MRCMFNISATLPGFCWSLAAGLTTIHPPRGRLATQLRYHDRSLAIGREYNLKRVSISRKNLQELHKVALKSGHIRE